MKKITLPLVLASTFWIPHYTSAVEEQNVATQNQASFSLEDITVKVIQRQKNYITKASGTIIGYQKNGNPLVLTNQHAIELMGSYEGVTIHYNNQDYTGTVIAHEHNNDTDLAIVSFNSQEQVPFVIVAKNDITLGDPVIKCGYKHGREYNQLQTKVIEGNVKDGLITEADSINGESGGGLFSLIQEKDKRQKLVGVCYGGGSKELEYHAAYIPGETVRHFLKKNGYDYLIEQ